MKTYTALSVVAPSGQNIATGLKTIEVRKWKPEQLPLKDLVIVENRHFLHQDGDEEEGIAVALVDILAVHQWTEAEIIPACANYWEIGYWAWEVSNVRPFNPPIATFAKRKIYEIQL